MGVLFPVYLSGLMVREATETKQAAVGFRMLIVDSVVSFDQLLQSWNIPEVSFQTNLGWGLISDQPADGVLLVISEEAVISWLRFGTNSIRPVPEIGSDPFPDREYRSANDGCSFSLAISSRQEPECVEPYFGSRLSFLPVCVLQGCHRLLGQVGHSHSEIVQGF